MKSDMKMDKREVMKRAHRRYKIAKGLYPDTPLKFSDFLADEWCEYKYDFYTDAYLNSVNEPDGWACYDTLPVNILEIMNHR